MNELKSEEPEIDVTTDSCQCPCCSNYDTAHHPTDLQKSKLMSVGRQSIQPSWYTKHEWISVCTSSYKIFCQVCCSAAKHGLITFSKQLNHAFINVGFVTGKSTGKICRTRKK